MPSEYQPDQSLFNKLEAFNFSERIVQYFCGTCGAHIIERSTVRKGPESDWKVSYGIMSGTLEKPDLDLTSHVYIGDTGDGGLADLLPRWHGNSITRYAKYNDQNVTLPLYWKDERAAMVAKQPGDKLHAHCKCGGVQFWMKRDQQAAKNVPEQRPEPSQEGALCTPELAAWVKAKSGKYLACLCVCNSCRQGAGHEITSWALIPTADIFIDAELKKPYTPSFGSLKWYESSPGHKRSFCSECGARAFYQADKTDDTIDVAVGLFDAAEGARASSWIEWQFHRLGFRDDAQGRAPKLLQALEAGIEDFVKHQQEVETVA